MAFHSKISIFQFNRPIHVTYKPTIENLFSKQKKKRKPIYHGTNFILTFRLSSLSTFLLLQSFGSGIIIYIKINKPTYHHRGKSSLSLAPLNLQILFLLFCRYPLGRNYHLSFFYVAATSLLLPTTVKSIYVHFS